MFVYKLFAVLCNFGTLTYELTELWVCECMDFILKWDDFNVKFVVKWQRNKNNEFIQMAKTLTSILLTKNT